MTQKENVFSFALDCIGRRFGEKQRKPLEHCNIQPITIAYTTKNYCGSCEQFRDHECIRAKPKTEN